MTIVSNAVGLPEEGRERMMEWSIGMFNCFGPMNERARNTIPVLSEMMHYARTQAVPGKLKPESWAEAIHHAAAAGEVPPEAVPVLMIDYMGPASTRRSSAFPAAWGCSPSTPISGTWYAMLRR